MKVSSRNERVLCNGSELGYGLSTFEGWLLLGNLRIEDIGRLSA